MGVNSKTPIHVLTGDMMWLTTKVRIFLEIIKYYNRLIKMDHSRLTYKVFEYDLQNISNENWSGDLETILNQIGMTETIFTGTEIDLDSAKEKLSVVSDLDWQGYRDNFFTYICRNVSKKFMNNDAVDKFIFLMKLNGKHIRKFANYLVSIWEYRKSVLYTNN